jgi:hypothetical protein
MMKHFLDQTNASNSISQSRRTGRFRGLFALLAAMLLLLSAPSVFAQGITGTITGTVTDPTGAIVPNAKVTITQVDTNAVRTIMSSGSGTYSVPQLPPGKYSVKVDAKGFKGFKQTNIVLQIDQIAQVDATLTLGAENDTVEVTASGAVLQTEDSSIGSVVDAQAIQNTPLNGHNNIVGLIALAPGVQNAGAQDQLATRGVTAAVGTGARNSYGSLGSTLDGVTNQEVTLQRGEGEVPSLDAISQFKVLTSGAPAARTSCTVRASSSTAPREPRPSCTPFSLPPIQPPALPTSATSMAETSQARCIFLTSTTARIAPSSSSPLKGFILRSPTATTPSNQPRWSVKATSASFCLVASVRARAASSSPTRTSPTTSSTRRR